MSWETQAWVWCQPNMGANEKLVALALGNHGDSYGNDLRPGMARLCHMTGLSESTVKRSIKLLLDSGILILVREADGRGRANEYRMPVDMEVVAEHHKKGFKYATEKGVQISKGVQPDEKRGSNEAEKGVHSDPPDSNIKLSVKTQIPRDVFEEFWAAYPARRTENGAMRKIGKEAARKLYPQAIKLVSHADLMAAVARLTQLTAVEYIPDPERWLKHRRWEDELLPGLASAEITGNGHVNGFRIAASAPPDAWAPLADKMSLSDDGSMHPEAASIFLDRTALEICEITGLDPNEPRGDWPVMVAWAREGLFDMPGAMWQEYLLPELRRICARPGYKPPGGLAYFTPALKANWR